MPRAPRVLLFDLGGVLVDWVGISGVRELSRRRLSLEDLRRYWLESPCVRAYERGETDSETFSHRVVEDLEIELAPDAFLDAYCSYVRGPLPGAHALLDRLRAMRSSSGPVTPIIACLSNTNEAHWRRIRDDFEFGARFDRTFLSFELGEMKPDAAVYAAVLRELAVAPQEIAFFDDNPECVEGAARAGFIARETRGVEALRGTLAELGALE